MNQHEPSEMLRGRLCFHISVLLYAPACPYRFSSSLSEPLPTRSFTDFEFMTTDRNYTGQSTHTLDKISEWLWADRSEGDAKEEIVAGHRCQRFPADPDLLDGQLLKTACLRVQRF